MADSNSFRLGVLGSGKGSNFVAVAEACARGDVAADVAIVLSDVEGAGILSHAERLGVVHRFISPGDYRTKLDEDAEQEVRRLKSKCRALQVKHPDLSNDLLFFL